MNNISKPQQISLGRQDYYKIDNCYAEAQGRGLRKYGLSEQMEILAETGRASRKGQAVV